MVKMNKILKGPSKIIKNKVLLASIEQCVMYELNLSTDLKSLNVLENIDESNILVKMEKVANNESQFFEKF